MSIGGHVGSTTADLLVMHLEKVQCVGGCLTGKSFSVSRYL